MVSLIKASFVKRKSNFTYSETDLLLKELEDNKDILLAAPGTYKNRKREMWDEITTKINSIGEGDERTMEEVRKKWSDMQCLAKRKYTKGKQELNEFEVRVLAMRGEGDRFSGRDGSFEDHDDSNFEFDTLSEAGIQIKQEKQDFEYDHPPVHFDGTEDVDHVDEYPETPIPFDQSPRKRKSNFSALERNALVEEVKKHRSIIMSKSNDTFTHERKRIVWEEITASVNQRGRGNYRSVEEVRKKWNDMQSLARRKKRKKASKSKTAGLLDSNSDSLHGRELTPDESMDFDGIEEASRSVDGTEEGSLDHSDIMERVMASAYSEEAEADQEEIDLIEDDDVEDSNDSNCSEWTPGSRRKHSSSSNKPRKGNFTTVETNILLDEIYKRRKIIFSPNLDRKSTEKKRREWNRVAQRISNACNKELRTLTEVRKKWSDLYTRASKFKTKKRAPTIDANFESDIDKINKRVLFIMEQKDEEQRKHDEDFEASMFGKHEDDEEESPPILKMESMDGDSVKEEFDTVSQEGSQGTDDLDSGIIIVQVQDGHKKGQDKVVDVINLKKEPPSQPASVDSALVIENVSTIDEKLFSSMDTHEVSPPPDDKTQLDRNQRNKYQNRTSPRNVSSTISYKEPPIKKTEQFIFRKRKGKFTSRETLILLDEVKKYKSLLLSKVTNGSVNEKKMCKWYDIVAKINQIRTGVPRTVDEVKKKWYDLQCNAKKKRALQESLFERLKLQEKEVGEDTDKMPAHLVRSHSKLLSLLGTAEGVSKSGQPQNNTEVETAEMAVQADCESEGTIEGDTNLENMEQDAEKMDDYNSNSNDANGPISTDKIRDNVPLNVKSVPNMLTNMDWKVLEITDGRVSELANYAAMDHNYHDPASTKKSPSKPEESVYVPENPVGLKIASVVSHAEVYDKMKFKSPEKKATSEDTASTISHINADVAHQRLRVEKKRLIVEKRRLNIEQEKLRLLRRLVKMEEDKATAREQKRKAREEKRSAKRAKRKAAMSKSSFIGVSREENGIPNGIERLTEVCNEMTGDKDTAEMNSEEEEGIAGEDETCREEDRTAEEGDRTAEEEDGTVEEEDETAREEDGMAGEEDTPANDYEGMSNVSDAEERHESDGEMEEGSREENMSDRGEESNVEEEINNEERSEDEQSDYNDSVSDDEEHNVAISYLQCD